MCFCSRCEPKVKLALKFLMKLKKNITSLRTSCSSLRKEPQNSLKMPAKHLTTHHRQFTQYVTSLEGNAQHILFNQITSYASAAGAVPTSEYNTVDRKSNVIVYGIKESSNHTTRSKCIKNNLSKVVETFSDIDDHIEANAIKDLFRLGKYQRDCQRLRPILVKFLHSSDALSILSKEKRPPVIYYYKA